MAEAAKKKESKGERRYGHGPRITEKEPAAGGGGPKTAAMVEGGDAAPAGDAMAGTDGIPSNATTPSQPGGEETAPAGDGGAPMLDRHMSEHKDMGKRHAREMKDMHSRHADEHRKMSERHASESTGGEE